MSTVAQRGYANGRARREQILDAALDLFVAQGYGAVSLRDIAASAGLSHPGLLRHFSSKAELLLSLVQRFEEGNASWVDAAGASSDTGLAGDLAEHNSSLPGYVQLFTALLGEATPPGHPAHTHFRARYARIRTLMAARLSGADAYSRAIRFTAAWDGLQVQSLYDSGIDVAAALRHSFRTIRRDVERPTAPRPLPVAIVVQADDAGYAKGRERRARIVADATKLFAAGGFHSTSLRDIAECAGISKSTLLHHFVSKEELLTAVLVHRDQQILAVPEPSDGGARAELLSIVDAARQQHSQRGLIELYAVLSCEATAQAHPAHTYFERRNENGRRYFTNLFQRLQASGEVAAWRDAEHEAAWLIALWDGLQFQWLYDPSAVDVADGLAEHLASLLD